MNPLAVPALLAALQGAPDLDPTPRLSAEEARADLALLWRALEELHPGLGRYEPAAETRAAFDALEERLAGGTSLGRLYLELSLLAGRLRCGHTRVEAPPALEELRAARPTHLPFAFRLLEGRMIVSAVAAEVAGLARGDEVLGLDGVPVATLVERLAATVPIDGFTDHARPSRLDTPYEFEDSGLDHYLPYVHGFRERFELAVRAPLESTPRTVVVPAVSAARNRALHPAAAADFPDGVRLRDVDATTAVLEVETFVNYRRPVAPESVLAPLFRGLVERGIEHLIVDLRACGGGSGDVAWTLARFLAREPFQDAARAPRVKRIRFGDLVPHLETWIPDAFEMPEEAFRKLEDGSYEVLAEQPTRLAPHPDAFPGRITILTGPFNASGATLLLAVLREHAEVRYVGEPTAGSAEGPTAGLLFFLTLPASRIRVNVPVFSQRSSATRIEPGLGVAPDVLVPETIADLLAGRDAALEAARR
ncbi:MAG TPA: S41 family peptidase [Planctomycetota bacterium]